MGVVEIDVEGQMSEVFFRSHANNLRSGATSLFDVRCSMFDVGRLSFNMFDLHVPMKSGYQNASIGAMQILTSFISKRPHSSYLGTVFALSSSSSSLSLSLSLNNNKSHFILQIFQQVSSKSKPIGSPERTRGFFCLWDELLRE
ncbi:MAG: hypothetical protein KKH84_07935 [Proteobacteria bacterium]|nr:hypothetical protein [Pseudomonadota bacterium]